MLTSKRKWSSTAVYTIHAGLYPKPPFDIVRDFDPVTLIGTVIKEARIKPE